jgi:hypothetical protein
MNRIPKAKRPWWMPPLKDRNWSKSSNAELYNMTAWRKLAAAHKKANPLCVRCLAKGIRTPVTDTDHIRAVRDGGDPLAWDNLQSLCKPCHMDKSNEERQHRRGGGYKT